MRPLPAGSGAVACADAAKFIAPASANIEPTIRLLLTHVICRSSQSKSGAAKMLPYESRWFDERHTPPSCKSLK
jgi:hypothetical protein